MVAGTGQRDFQAALESLLDNGCIEGSPAYRLESLVELAAAGRLTLTPVGQRRLDEDDV